MVKQITSADKHFQMPAGEYYVGDLCYVLGDRWDQVCDLIISGNECLEGKFVLPDGTEFCIYNTKYGDGCYEDQYGNTYDVDAGSIGCVLVSAIKGELPHSDYYLLEEHKDFVVGRKDGTITIGPLDIDTDPREEEYDEYEEEEEEDV